jgi:predicted acylesterase/phospholipase RssA
MIRSILLSLVSLTAVSSHLSDYLQHKPIFSSNNLSQLPNCSVLALSGGGSFGAVELGVLDGLLQTGSVPDTVDIITGISAGGLNAGYLSYYSSLSEALPPLYTIMANLTTPDIYESNILHILTDWSIYTTAPLEKTLSGILSNVKPSPQDPTPITLIGATNVNRQTLDVFRFDQAPTLQERLDILMSTTAIPFVFPPHIYNNTLYVDGGVIANEMISQAVGQKQCNQYAFTFISASNRHAAINITGLFSYISAIGHLLLDTFDYQLAEYETLNCNHPRGTIQACFPTSPLLDQYSILDFDHQAELYEIGKSSYDCQVFQYCG